MSLFRSSVRQPSIHSDEAIARYLADLRAHLDPDPLFRRRLRGTVTNRFVATREGLAIEPHAKRSMGRLGRAVLYASFALAASVTSVMAASQEAVPGDALYPLKQQIEALRVRALPAHLHDELAANELRERISEMATLSERGAWEQVAALAAVIEHDYESLASDPDVRAGDSLVLVDGSLEQLPPEARVAVQGVMSGMPGVAQRRTPANAGIPSGNDNAEQGGAGPNVAVPHDRADEARSANPGTENAGSSNAGSSNAGSSSAGSSTTASSSTGSSNGNAPGQEGSDPSGRSAETPAPDESPEPDEELGDD